MQKFIEFITKYKEYFTFTALTVISLSLISLEGSHKIGGFRASVIGLVGTMQDMFSWIPNPGALRSENKALRELNLQLSSEVTRMRRALIENENLRELLQLKSEIDRPFTTAEMIGKTSIELRHYITINKGYADSVFAGMAVRNDAGLVGLIMGASNNYSVVELIKNREVKISARIQERKLDGIISWDGSDVFLMKYIPKKTDVNIGDIVTTSNLSNKYPKDVPIGKIIRIEDDPGTIFYKIYVEPFVNFDTIDQLFVIKYIPDPERTELIKNIEERLGVRQTQKKN